jgi:hypothetical protein
MRNFILNIAWMTNAKYTSLLARNLLDLYQGKLD